MKAKITYRSWQGHYICDCRNHLNTLIEYEDKKVVVSSLGGLFVDGKLEKIGAYRYYETFCFMAKEDKFGFVDADVKKRLDYDSVVDCETSVLDEKERARMEKQSDINHYKTVDLIVELLENNKPLKRQNW